MSTESSNPERSLNESKGLEITQKNTESLESGLDLRQIVSLHLAQGKGRLFEAGGGYDTITAKEVIKRFDMPYESVDPANNVGGRNHNIRWSKDRHDEAVERLNEDDLYATSDVPGVLDAVREYSDDRRVELGVFSGHQRDLEDAMSEWTQMLSGADAELAVAVKVDEGVEGYLEEDNLSEEAYRDMLDGLGLSESDTYSVDGWEILRTNYSK